MHHPSFGDLAPIPFVRRDNFFYDLAVQVLSGAVATATIQENLRTTDRALHTGYIHRTGSASIKNETWIELLAIPVGTSRPP